MSTTDLELPVKSWGLGAYQRERERERGEYYTFTLSLIQVGDREREGLTPFQPHRADAGAARTPPGRSQKGVSNTVLN